MTRSRDTAVAAAESYPASQKNILHEHKKRASEAGAGDGLRQLAKISIASLLRLCGVLSIRRRAQ